MTAYTGAVPVPERTLDWRDAGLCRRKGESPEDWFPAGGGPAAEAAEVHAKAVCWQCPSLQPCGQSALENREPAGIWGGMSEKERRKILRRRGITLLDVSAEETRVRTLQSMWDERTQQHDDGHVTWTGTTPTKIQGINYTPRQIAFALDRDRPPVSHVKRTCQRDGCIAPSHVADQQEREELRAAGLLPPLYASGARKAAV